MTSQQEERLVAALEKIATALTGIDDTNQRQYAKQWPERKAAREAVYSRLPSEEDLIRAEHGGSSESGNESLGQWLSISGDEEAIGPREREFRERQSAGAQTATQDLPGGSSAETPEDQT